MDIWNNASYHKIIGMHKALHLEEPGIATAAPLSFDQVWKEANFTMDVKMKQWRAAHTILFLVPGFPG